MLAMAAFIRNRYSVVISWIVLAAYQPRALAYASYTASVGSPVSTPSMVSCQVSGSASPDSTQAA